jgi:hypothetical protein
MTGRRRIRTSSPALLPSTQSRFRKVVVSAGQCRIRPAPYLPAWGRACKYKYKYSKQ